MKKFLVSPCPKATRVLFEIQECLDRHTCEVGSAAWPGPLYILCAQEDAGTVRELITESGLNIVEEKN
jgi:hypothetical protein